MSEAVTTAGLATGQISQGGDSSTGRVLMPLLPQEKLDGYIAAIPPLPETLRACMEALDSGDLGRAAAKAQKDPALCHYLISQVNRSYLLRQTVDDVTQAITSLGLIYTRQLMAAYIVTLLSRNGWRFFEYDDQRFQHLQIAFMKYWNTILVNEGYGDDSVLSLPGILLPATLAVCDQLFGDAKEEVELLQRSRNLECNEILKRISGVSLFQLAEIIGLKWRLPERATRIVLLAEGEQELEPVCEADFRLARLLHLLTFYLLSLPDYYHGDLLGFCYFNTAFTEPVQEGFLELMEKNYEA